MDEVLTIDEITARFAPDWVLIGEPQTDEFQHLHAGKVLFHSPDREEVYRKAIELRPCHFAFRHLGKLPEDMAFVLAPSLPAVVSVDGLLGLDFFRRLMLMVDFRSGQITLT